MKTILLALAIALAPARGGAPAQEVRVGVVTASGFGEVERYERLFTDLAAAPGSPFHFRMAAGSYGEVLSWIDGGLVDAAVMGPGLYAERMERLRYLATLGTPNPTCVGTRFEYRSVALVAESSPIRNLGDLRRAAEEDRLDILFVHPLSVSGRVLPDFLLRKEGIRANPIYTFSHANSLKLLAEPPGDRARVAFLWDDAAREAPGTRPLDFPALADRMIPGDVIASRADWTGASALASLLARHKREDGSWDAVALEDAETRYAVVSDWARELGPAPEIAEHQEVTLEEIGRILLHYARAHPPDRPLRLALVLSGGGAKCAYQVGAVSAVEERLADLRAQDTVPGLDIALVVGTSGGAINAIPVAMGLSSTPEGREEFRAMWQGMDAAELVRPSRLVRANMALWFTAILAGGVYLLGRSAGTSSKLLLFLAAPGLVLGYLSPEPGRLFGERHLLHHIWLWMTFGMRGAGWCLLALGLAIRARGEKPLPRGTGALLLVAAIGLPLLQGATLAFREETLCEGAGVEASYARVFSRLLAPNEAVRPAAEIGQEILGQGLLRRDLVLSASSVTPGSSLPSDLYFYASARPGDTPPDFGPRGVPLADHPDNLLDIVIGSGSIYPVYPARRIPDFPGPGEEVRLIDGGFAHNSPLEAAVRWGATHVLIIEASPETRRRESRNFLENCGEAFKHLYDQAQMVDARSKDERVQLFTLRPSEPHLCVLDFSPNLVEGGIAKGYREARGEVLRDASGGAVRLAGVPTFRKELRRPLFWDLVATP